MTTKSIILLLLGCLAGFSSSQDVSTAQGIVDAPVFNIVVRRIPQDPEAQAAHYEVKQRFLDDLLSQPGTITNIEFKAIRDAAGNDVDDIDIGIWHVESRAASDAANAGLDGDLLNEYLATFEFLYSVNLRAYTIETLLEVENSFPPPPAVITLDVRRVNPGQLYEFNAIQIEFNDKNDEATLGNIFEFREYQSITDSDLRGSTNFLTSSGYLDVRDAGYLTQTGEDFQETFTSDLYYAMERRL